MKTNKYIVQFEVFLENDNTANQGYHTSNASWDFTTELSRLTLWTMEISHKAKVSTLKVIFQMPMGRL